jgi:hypothetical protein
MYESDYKQDLSPNVNNALLVKKFPSLDYGPGCKKTIRYLFLINYLFVSV